MKLLVTDHLFVKNSFAEPENFLFIISLVLNIKGIELAPPVSCCLYFLNFETCEVLSNYGTTYREVLVEQEVRMEREVLVKFWKIRWWLSKFELQIQKQMIS